jgi:hypothetical protein
MSMGTGNLFGHRFLSVAFIAVAAWFMSSSAIGCGYTKGYVGPELPPEKVSRISFSVSSPLSISGEAVDTVPVSSFNAGIDVLPGKHIAATSVSTEANERCGSTSCDVTVERDKDGYVKSRSCTCSQDCDVEVFEGDCSVSFSSNPGKEYSISVRQSYRGSGYRAQIDVMELGGRGTIGTGECSELNYSGTRNYEKTVPSYDCNVY